MTTNPDSSPQPEENPYLKVARANAAAAQVLQNLNQLVPEMPEAAPPAEAAAPAPSLPPQGNLLPQTRSRTPYVSAFETPPPQTNRLPTQTRKAARSEYVPASELSAKLTPADTETSGFPASAAPNPYQSPQATGQAKQAQRRQLQQQAEAAAVQRRQAETEATTKRRLLEKQAQQFLDKLDNHEAAECDRLWFEAFAELCPSRLDAAIEFIQTMSPA